MATKAEKAAKLAEEAKAEEARRAALTQEERDAEDAAAAPKKGKKVEKVVFHLKNGHSRTFSPADHGDDFEKVASEFEATNRDSIASKE